MAPSGYRPRRGQICVEGEKRGSRSASDRRVGRPFRKGSPRGRSGRFDRTVTRAVPLGQWKGLVEERERVEGQLGQGRAYERSPRSSGSHVVEGFVNNPRCYSATGADKDARHGARIKSAGVSSSPSSDPRFLLFHPSAPVPPPRFFSLYMLSLYDSPRHHHHRATTIRPCCPKEGRSWSVFWREFERANAPRSWWAIGESVR